MTPARLGYCLSTLNWTQRGLARQLDRPEGTVRQWAKGTVEIPDEVAIWLELRTRHAERHPPPGRVPVPLNPETVAILDEVDRGFRSVRNAAKLLGVTSEEVQIRVWGEIRQ